MVPGKYDVASSGFVAICISEPSMAKIRRSVEVLLISRDVKPSKTALKASGLIL